MLIPLKTPHINEHLEGRCLQRPGVGSLKPDKGRRKDLKKVETLVEELHLMIRN
jgi:hypothetical protein